MIDGQSIFEIHRLRDEGLSVRKISRLLKPCSCKKRSKNSK